MSKAVAIDLAVIVLAGLAIFSGLALYGNGGANNLVGVAGERVLELLYHQALGAGSYFIPPAFALVPALIYLREERPLVWRLFAASLAGVFYGSAVAGLYGLGGEWGNWLTGRMETLVGEFWPVLVVLTGVALVVGISGRAVLSPVFDFLARTWENREPILPALWDGAQAAGESVAAAFATAADFVTGADLDEEEAEADAQPPAETTDADAEAGEADQKEPETSGESEDSTENTASAESEPGSTPEAGENGDYDGHAPDSLEAEEDHEPTISSPLNELAEQEKEEAGSDSEPAAVNGDGEETGEDDKPVSPTQIPVKGSDLGPPEEELVLSSDQTGQVRFSTKQSDGSYQLPPMELLAEAKRKKHDPGDLKERAEVIERTLTDFNIEARVSHIQEGPRVTRFEIRIGPGISVRKVSKLSDNLALELAVPAVRIEAPIPGKKAIGIEVPNQKSRLITLRSILESDEMQSADHRLTMSIGRDIAGEPMVGNLSDMPHLLIAGATGSGKSVCLNSIITTFLMRCAPHELRMILIDPKMVEMAHYADIPHLLTPVVNDVQEAENAFSWLLSEMEDRFQLFADAKARNIDAYNEQADPSERIPYIVLLIDELSDLMMMAGNTIEKQICRLAQKARAAGIHMVIATQRPDVKVITGTIKANIPSRIAFEVVSQADSRTILDKGGAEKLLGSGDMLYSPTGSSQPVRVQGSFVSDDEIQRVTDFIREQMPPDYIDEITSNELDELGQEDDDTDELYEEALEIILEDRRASTSYLQRKLEIGYNRAARIMEQLHENGVVGPLEGNKPRDILVD